MYLAEQPIGKLRGCNLVLLDVAKCGKTWQAGCCPTDSVPGCPSATLCSTRPSPPRRLPDRAPRTASAAPRPLASLQPCPSPAKAVSAELRPQHRSFALLNSAYSTGAQACCHVCEVQRKSYALAQAGGQCSACRNTQVADVCKKLGAHLLERRAAAVGRCGRCDRSWRRRRALAAAHCVKAALLACAAYLFESPLPAVHVPLDTQPVT